MYQVYLGTALTVLAFVGMAWVIVIEWRYHSRILNAWQAGYENGVLLTGLPWPRLDDERMSRAYNEGYRTGLSKRRASIAHAEPKRTRSAGWTRVMDYMRD